MLVFATNWLQLIVGSTFAVISVGKNHNERMKYVIPALIDNQFT